MKGMGDFMKKIVTIIISIIIILIISLGTLYIIDKNRMKNNKPVVFSTWGYNYAPPVKSNEDGINKAIKEYILSRNNNENCFMSMKTYLIDEKNESKIIVYAWVLEECISKEDGELVKGSGSSGPYKFTLTKDNNNYSVVNHKMPRDGSLYSKDMKKIFPKEVLESMNKVHSDGTIEELVLDVERQANQYFDGEIITNNNSFIGTVLEETTTYMIVEPNEDEFERKSSDKIVINYGTDHRDYLFGVGRKVLISYDGYIKEIYPAQIDTDNIEINGYSDFELIITKDNETKTKKILNNKDINSNNQDLNLYYYGLEKIDVKVDNKTLPLETALRDGKITLQGIVEKANKDLDNGTIKGDMYKDGGSMIYEYGEYTIIKCNTLDGNRDIYIGISDMTLNNVK